MGTYTFILPESKKLNGEGRPAVCCKRDGVLRQALSWLYQIRRSSQSFGAYPAYERGAIILVWDNATIHRSQKVKSWLEAHPEITVEYLPPYAPALNPEEYVHGYVKQRTRKWAF